VIAEIVARLLPEREKVTADVVDAILQEIPEFADDARMRSLLEAAASENVSAVMHAIALGSRLDAIEAPAAGLEHARILAQREVPITVLLRAYRLGQTRFIEDILERIRSDEAMVGEPAMALVRIVSRYIDRISERVAQAYEEEREMRVGSKAAMRQHWVNLLLTSDSPDVAQAEGALRYRLAGWHVAVEVWVDGTHDSTSVVGYFDRAAALFKRVAGSRSEHLGVPVDAFHMRFWLHVDEGFTVDVATLTRELAEANIPVRLAVGEARHGVPGFRSSAVSARRVRTLALAGGTKVPAVLSHADVAPMVLISNDPIEVEHFVSATLGDLAMPDPRCEDLRETLLVYLEANRSYHVAATQLHVHRNTVHYRVQQAMDMVGVELGANTLALQLALTICRWRAVQG